MANLYLSLFSVSLKVSFYKKKESKQKDEKINKKDENEIQMQWESMRQKSIKNAVDKY